VHLFHDLQKKKKKKKNKSQAVPLPVVDETTYQLPASRRSDVDVTPPVSVVIFVLVSVYVCKITLIIVVR